VDQPTLPFILFAQERDGKFAPGFRITHFICAWHPVLQEVSVHVRNMQHLLQNSNPQCKQLSLCCYEHHALSVPLPALCGNAYHLHVQHAQVIFHKLITP
jgi:hypothetical protein